MSEFYQLRMPSQVVGGKDVHAGLLSVLRETGGKKIALFTDHMIRKAGLTDGIMRTLEEAGCQVSVLDDLTSEPTVYQADACIREFRAIGADLIIAVGGGSVMDIAKLASVLFTDEYTIFDLLEKPSIAYKQLKTVMIPTTAGTGSEATPNSIVTVPEKALKVGIVNPAMISDYVILDVNMIRDLPRSIAAATGVDALAHAIECYTSNKATPFSDVFALEAMRLIFPNIVPACSEKDNLRAKQSMLTGAFLAGVAIASSGTTAVHALSYPLGGQYHIAHGVSNAMLLAPVMRFNASACADRLAVVYDAVMEPAQLTTQEKAKRVVQRLEEIVRLLDIPRDLTVFGVPKEDMDQLVEAGMQVTRLLNNNIRKVTAEDARMLYLQIMP